jgi:hypothetical protein
MLVDLFERIGRFFKRLESYTERTPSEGMADMMVEVMVEVLSVLAIVTVEIKQRRRSQSIASNRRVPTHVSLEKFLKKLLGRNDVEDALKRLDKLTQEEAKMATSEVLKSTRNVDDNVKMLIDGIQSEFFSHTYCPDGIYYQTTRRQERFCNKRNVRHFLLLRPFFRGSAMVTGKQMRQDIHSWLSPVDPSTNHEIASNAHHEGTATWFFHGGIFEEWRTTPSLLWINGKRTLLSLPST